MRQRKILKNVTQEVVTVMGREFQAGESKEFLPHLFLELTYNDAVKALIADEILVVNNGTRDLSKEDGLAHIERLVDPWDPAHIPVRRCVCAQFCYTEKMDYTQYMVSWTDNDTQKNRLKRGGDESNGFKYGGCCPIVCPMNGKAISAHVVCKGAAVSTGSPGSIISLNFELWDVGFSNEGTKISDIVVPITRSVNPVGKWWNTYDEDTHLNLSLPLDIDLSLGNMLALKFIRKTGNNDVVAARGVLVVLTILESEG